MVDKQKKNAMKKSSKDEKYLNMVFTMMRKSENFAVTKRTMRFNDTEIRLIGEVLSAKYQGKRLISTQLATLLGVTRSAISQIVNRLESEGVLCRVPDEVDRKIFYIEVTDNTLETYGENLNECAAFVGRVVKSFGEDRFNELYQLFEEFIEKAKEEQATIAKKKAN